MSIEGQETGLGWLTQPVWGTDVFGEIAGAKQMTPDVLRAVEGLLAATAKKVPATPVKIYCPALEECGVYKGGYGDCEHLKKCTSYTNVRIPG